MINSRKIEDLDADVAAKCKLFIDTCAEADIDVIITSTYRDHVSQDALYAQGRTAPGSKVTNARGGFSFHNFKVAFDFVPIVNGKAIWNDSALWTRCGQIGVDCGLEWGGDWTSFVDKPHMQDTGGKTLVEFRAESIKEN